MAPQKFALEADLITMAAPFSSSSSSFKLLLLFTHRAYIKVHMRRGRPKSAPWRRTQSQWRHAKLLFLFTHRAYINVHLRKGRPKGAPWRRTRSQWRHPFPLPLPLLNFSFYSPTEHTSTFICVDGAPEVRPGGGLDHNGATLFLVSIHCGSLPCPPYEQGRELTCVVCSRRN